MSTKILPGQSGRTYRLNPSEGEPVLSRLVVTAVGGVVLALGTRWGLPIDEATAHTLAVVIVAAAPVAGALWARRKSWSGQTVAEVVEQARREAVGR